MKKIVWIFVLFLTAGAAWAEELSFVTTLSSPVGTFSMLETGNPQANVTASTVNFCNTRVAAGQINIGGLNSPYLANLVFANGTVLGGDVPEFRVVSQMEIFSNVSLTGGRLMADNVGFANVTSAKSEVKGTLYGTTAMVVKGAGTDALVIPSQTISAGRGTGTKMHWSNEYNRDYDCSKNPCVETGSSYTSYLLKSIEGTEVTPPTPKTYTSSQTFSLLNVRSVGTDKCTNLQAVLPGDELEALSWAKNYVSQASMWAVTAPQVGDICYENVFSNAVWTVGQCNVATGEVRLNLQYTVYYCN